MTVKFKHDLGSKAKSKTTQLTGVITIRSECLYGCNRYLIQPPVNADSKLPDSYWVDEDDIEIIEPPAVKKLETNRGGPISKKC